MTMTRLLCTVVVGLAWALLVLYVLAYVTATLLDYAVVGR